jgi:hypothetical protein
MSSFRKKFFKENAKTINNLCISRRQNNNQRDSGCELCYISMTIKINKHLYLKKIKESDQNTENQYKGF